MSSFPLRWFRSAGVAFALCGAAGCATVQSGARGEGAELPTLELAHVRAGELPVLPEADRPAAGAASLHATYRVCVHRAERHALSVTPVLGDAAAHATLVPALGAASWELTGAKGDDEALCFLESLESGPDGAWRTSREPYFLAGPDRIEKDGDAVPQLPDEVVRRLVGKDVVGLYRMCAAAGTGAVSSVTPVVSVPGADGDITSALRTWTYAPGASESCWLEPLRFTLTPAAPAPDAARPTGPSKQPVDMRAH